MRTATALCLLLLSGAGVFAQCRPPLYQEGATFLDSETSLAKNISIPLQDFVPTKLICLAMNLKELYRDRTSIMVNIFSSQEASLLSILVSESTKEDLEAFAQMHAQYIFDADKHEEYVNILPAGATPRPFPSDGPYRTRINLPAPTTTRCNLHIINRCLIALEEITYPSEILKRKASGTVVLTAIITPTGDLNHVRVLMAKSVPEGVERVLADAAVQNLSSWRMETGPRESAIHITYSYVIDSSLRHADGAKVQWSLPNKITIGGNPVE